VSDTPRTDSEAFLPHDSKYQVCDADFARILERELNAANVEIQRLRKSNLQLREGAEEQKQRIRLLIAERDTARLQTDQKHSLREEFRELLGTDDIEVGVAVVREMRYRIKRLKEALDLVRPHCDSVHHSKKHQHQYGEPCPVVALIENAKEAKL
jgi:predicted RNase H-like nuclease (RuvC/YqgF family)